MVVTHNRRTPSSRSVGHGEPGDKRLNTLPTSVRNVTLIEVRVGVSVSFTVGLYTVGLYTEMLIEVRVGVSVGLYTEMLIEVRVGVSVSFTVGLYTEMLIWRHDTGV